MKTKLWIAAAGIVAGSIALGLVGRAQEGGLDRMAMTNEPARARMGMDGGGRMATRLLAMLDNDRVKSALGLTNEQVDRLRKIAVDEEKASVRTRAEMQVEGIELRELLRAENTDRQAVLKKVEQISNLRAEMMKQNVGALLDAKAVLTPEQQKKIRDFIGIRTAGGFEGPRNNVRPRLLPAPPAPTAPLLPPERPSGPPRL